MQTAEEYQDVYLSYMDFARRQSLLSEGEAQEAYISAFRDVARQCDEYLDTYFPTFHDVELKLPAYWARTEAKHFGNVKASDLFLSSRSLKEGQLNHFVLFAGRPRGLGSVR